MCVWSDGARAGDAWLRPGARPSVLRPGARPSVVVKYSASIHTHIGNRSELDVRGREIMTRATDHCLAGI